MKSCPDTQDTGGAGSLQSYGVQTLHAVRAHLPLNIMGAPVARPSTSVRLVPRFGLASSLGAGGGGASRTVDRPPFGCGCSARHSPAHMCILRHPTLMKSAAKSRPTSGSDSRLRTCCRSRPRGCCMPSPPFASALAPFLPSSSAPLPPFASPPCSACSSEWAAADLDPLNAPQAHQEQLLPAQREGPQPDVFSGPLTSHSSSPACRGRCCFHAGAACMEPAAIIPQGVGWKLRAHLGLAHELRKGVAAAHERGVGADLGHPPAGHEDYSVGRGHKLQLVRHQHARLLAQLPHQAAVEHLARHLCMRAHAWHEATRARVLFHCQCTASAHRAHRAWLKEGALDGGSACTLRLPAPHLAYEVACSTNQNSNKAIVLPAHGGVPGAV